MADKRIVEGEPPGAAGNPIGLARRRRRRLTERVVEGPSSEAEQIAIARWLIERLSPKCEYAHVDGFSDVKDLPADVATAMSSICDLAQPVRRLFRTDKTYMAIRVPVAPHKADLLAFAPYSIHAEFFASGWQSLLTLHDTSTGITLAGTTEDITAIERDLPVGVQLRDWRNKRR